VTFLIAGQFSKAADEVPTSYLLQNHGTTTAPATFTGYRQEPPSIAEGIPSVNELGLAKISWAGILQRLSLARCGRCTTLNRDVHAGLAHIRSEAEFGPSNSEIHSPPLIDARLLTRHTREAQL
jgi:hypothetical protein